MCCGVDGIQRLEDKGYCRGTHAPGSDSQTAAQSTVPASMNTAADQLIKAAALKPPPADLSGEQVASRYQAMKTTALARAKSKAVAHEA